MSKNMSNWGSPGGRFFIRSIAWSWVNLSGAAGPEGLANAGLHNQIDSKIAPVIFRNQFIALILDR
jgi:hypothetical protein